MVRMILSFVVTLLLAWIALTALAWLVADRMMFLPPPPSYDGARLPVVHVATEDGAQVAVLHLPNPAARFTIVYSHGNAEDIGYALPVLEELRDAGFGIIAYDYRGYGASTGGRPTTRGVIRDHDAVFRYAVEALRIPRERILLYGRSVGSGPATDLAARERVAGLILESAFTSAYVVLTRVPILPFDRFPNLRLIRDVGSPVLIIHGTADEVIPFSHGRRLYDAAGEPRHALWVDGAGHNDVGVVAGRRYLDALGAFADAL